MAAIDLDPEADMYSTEKQGFCFFSDTVDQETPLPPTQHKTFIITIVSILSCDPKQAA